MKNFYSYKEKTVQKDKSMEIKYINTTTKKIYNYVHVLLLHYYQMIFLNYYY